jgi:hypothetical protein
MPSPFLYSTNPWIKFDIYQRYRGQRHWVWCSDFYDSRKYYLHVGSGHMPPSSNPAEIYENLRASTLERPDLHCPTIARVKLNLQQRALEWVADGSLSFGDGQDIVYQLDHAVLADWRPLLYVIHRASVAPRLVEVPPDKRANPISPEWTLSDLAPDEFDVLGF